MGSALSTKAGLIHEGNGRSSMSDSDDKDTKPSIRLKRPGRLELHKTIETGQVRQSFSHGRSKAVTVEVRRKRTFTAGEGGRMKEVKAKQDDLSFASESSTGAASDARVSRDSGGRGRRSPAILKTLTVEEKEARARALEIARRDVVKPLAPSTTEPEVQPVAEPEVVDAEPPVEKPTPQPEVAEVLPEEAPAPAAKAKEDSEAKKDREDTKRQADSDARRKADEEAARRLAQAEEAGRRALQKAAANPCVAKDTETPERDESSDRGRRGKGEARRPTFRATPRSAASARWQDDGHPSFVRRRARS